LPELYRHFATAALLTGEYVEAETQGQRALALAREQDNHGEQGKSQRVLGEIAAAQNQAAAAEAHFAASAQILEAVADDYELARTRLAWAQLRAAHHQPEAARALLNQCQPVFERLEATLDVQAVQTLRTHLTA
jgi:uncharacterized membrane-anchored protein YhcB (DUF1043 family)